MEKNGQTYHLVNAYDEVVRNSVRSLMKNSDMCQCEKCYLDVCALVFNNGYTRFVTTHQGELFSKIPEMSHSYQVDLTVAVLEAISIVGKDPRH